MDENTTTHVTNIKGKVRTASSAPSDPQVGDEYYDTARNSWLRYSGNNWLGALFTAA